MQFLLHGVCTIIKCAHVHTVTEPPSIHFCPYFYSFAHIYGINIKMMELQWRHCYVRDPVVALSRLKFSPTTPRHKYKPEQHGFVCYLKTNLLLGCAYA